MIEILLDTADPDLYHLQYHLSYSGSYNFVPTPVTPIWVPPNNPNALTLNDWHTAIPRPELTAEPDD
jgi:hypothetical protein